MRRLWLNDERPIGAVPRWIMMVLFAALGMHAAYRASEPAPAAQAAALSNPPAVETLRVLNLGEPIVTSQLLMLYLQAFDNQPGVSIPFRELDYGRVIAWLGTALAFDPLAQYPLLMASQLYGQVNEPVKQREMCAFVQRAFFNAPNRRWRWLAHCAIMAKHRLHDMPLALRYAEDITRHAGAASNWARQMRIFILEDMGEKQRATVLLGGLLAGEEITDPKERHFLTERLGKLGGGENSTEPSRNRQ